MPNKPWTKEELELLLQKKKVPTRSKKSIHLKKISLGLLQPKYKIKFHSKKRWTAEEIELIKNNEKVPGRSVASMRNFAVRLGLVKPGNQKKPWLKKETKLLVQLCKQGKSAKQIFESKVLPYSKNSIQKKMCYMGLVKKNFKKVMFSKTEILKLENFLLDNWRGKTPNDLVNLWNSTENNKVNKSKVLYRLYRLKIKIPYTEVLKINNLRKKEEEIRNKSFKTSKIFEENLRLQRVKIMRERIGKNRNIWTGLPE